MIADCAKTKKKSGEDEGGGGDISSETAHRHTLRFFCETFLKGVG